MMHQAQDSDEGLTTEEVQRKKMRGYVCTPGVCDRSRAVSEFSDIGAFALTSSPFFRHVMNEIVKTETDYYNSLKCVDARVMPIAWRQ